MDTSLTELQSQAWKMFLLRGKHFHLDWYCVSYKSAKTTQIKSHENGLFWNFRISEAHDNELGHQVVLTSYFFQLSLFRSLRQQWMTNTSRKLQVTFHHYTLQITTITYSMYRYVQKKTALLFACTFYIQHRVRECHDVFCRLKAFASVRGVQAALLSQ